MVAERAEVGKGRRDREWRTRESSGHTAPAYITAAQ